MEEASRLFSENQRRDATSTLNRFDRKETERFKCFTYDDLIKRDKVNLDIFWLKYESLEAALEQFAEIAADLRTGENESEAG